MSTSDSPRASLVLEAAPMPKLSEITLDSNCLSFLIAALEGIARPTDNLADQKIALVRLYLYTPGTLWVTPTVKREFERIKDAARKGSHQRWTSANFGVHPVNDPRVIKRRATNLARFHKGKNDRMVLAEAEDVGFATLLSFDSRFVKHLASHTRLTLTTPAQLWKDLAIPKGAPPVKEPTPDNPLSKEQWWRW